MGVDAYYSCQPNRLVNRQINWNLLASSQVFTVLPAKHVRGIYIITAPIIVKTPNTIGVGSMVINWTSPDGTPQVYDTSAVAFFGFIATGLINSAPVAIPTDGTNPVTVQIPVAGTDAGLADVYAFAMLTNRL